MRRWLAQLGRRAERDYEEYASMTPAALLSARRRQVYRGGALGPRKRRWVPRAFRRRKFSRSPTRKRGRHHRQECQLIYLPSL